MKNLLWTIPALILGMVLGAWGPRADLRSAREQLRALQQEHSGKTGTRGEIGRAKALLGVSDAEIKQRAAERKVKRPSPPPATAASAAPALAPAVGKTGAPAVAATAPASMAKQIEHAAELWNARAALARNSLVSNVGLDATKATRFDVVTEAMNIRLEDSIRRWAEKLREKEAPTSEDGVRLMSEVSQALVITYDALDHEMPADWRSRVGGEFDLLSFIDPAVALPLVDVEDKLQTVGRHRHPPHTPAAPDGAGKPGVRVSIGVTK